MYGLFIDYYSLKIRTGIKINGKYIELVDHCTLNINLTKWYTMEVKMCPLPPPPLPPPPNRISWGGNPHFPSSG